MKVYRSKAFNTSNFSIWKNDIFSIGTGLVYTAKVIVTGFELKEDTVHFGPLTIRKYDQKNDGKLGEWSGRCCVVELKYQDEPEFGINMCCEPFWIIHSIFLALQVYVDSWIGMMNIYYFDSKGKYISCFECGMTVADSRSITEEPIIDKIDNNLLIKYMNAQYGKLELAIDRYCRACTGIVDDSIIYFVIVLENLLGKGLENGELKRKISLRGALLLSSNIDKRESYNIVFKYLYWLRSKMAHGNIDEIKIPDPMQKKAFMNLGVKPLGTLNDRYTISNIARKLARDVLLYFINHEDQWNRTFLEDLELGV